MLMERPPASFSFYAVGVFATIPLSLLIQNFKKMKKMMQCNGIIKTIFAFSNNPE